MRCKITISIIVLNILLINSLTKAQSSYLIYHNWESIPVSLDVYTGSNTGYAVHFGQFRRSILNVGLVSWFSVYNDYYETETAKSIFNNNAVYFLPIGFNIPLKQKRDMRFGINTKYYWSMNPNIVEIDLRLDKKFYSAYAGYRYSSFEKAKGFYVGVSFNYHYFSNNRRLSDSQKDELNNAICHSTEKDCIEAEISNKNYLVILANIRSNIKYTSPLNIIEPQYLNFNSLDSMCFNRSVDILNSIKTNFNTTELSGVEVYLYYSTFVLSTKYDPGSELVYSKQKVESNYFSDNTSGFSKTVLINQPFGLYGVKILQENLKDSIMPQELIVKNHINDYLQNLEYVNSLEIKK